MKKANWITNILTEDDLKQIENRIQSVEQETMAEIVVCIVRQSVPTATLFAFVNAFLLFLNLALFFTIPQLHSIWFFVISLPIVFILAKWLETQTWVIRTFMPKADRQALTLQRAMLEFYASDIKKTDKSTGIIIFLSIAEHAIHVLADKAIVAQFPPTQWQDAVTRIIDGIKQKKLKDSIMATLDSMLPELKKHFPVTEENRNELPDHVLVKDS